MAQKTPLKGKELLDKVRQLKDLSREEKAKACGYYTTTKSGHQRVNMSKFLNALIEAEGIELEKSTETTRGPAPSYRTTVHSNGNIVIGSVYTEQLGVQPGDEFEIRLGRKHIHLKQIDKEQEVEADLQEVA